MSTICVTIIFALKIVTCHCYNATKVINTLFGGMSLSDNDESLYLNAYALKLYCSKRNYVISLFQNQ